MSGMDSMMGGGGGGATPEVMLAGALRGRYVDESGEPVMDPDMTSRIRRMPVYLRFVVDQRYLSDVLVNCANCPMPINVLWVTVNPDSTQSFQFSPGGGTASGGMGGSLGGDFSGGGMSGRSSRSRSDSMGGSRGAGRMGIGTSTNDVDFGLDAITVEIFGSINIFAPPDRARISGL